METKEGNQLKSNRSWRQPMKNQCIPIESKQTIMKIEEKQWEPMQINIIQWQQIKNNEDQLQPMAIKYIQWQHANPMRTYVKHSDIMIKEN